MKNCRTVTQLMSESQERPLRLAEKMLLRIHTLTCPACREFNRQMPLLRTLSRGYAKGAEDIQPSTYTDDVSRD